MSVLLTGNRKRPYNQSVDALHMTFQNDAPVHFSNPISIIYIWESLTLIIIL